MTPMTDPVAGLAAVIYEAFRGAQVHQNAVPSEAAAVAALSYVRDVLLTQARLVNQIYDTMGWECITPGDYQPDWLRVADAIRDLLGGPEK